jgi:hypothetical protein
MNLVKNTPEKERKISETFSRLYQDEATRPALMLFVHHIMGSWVAYPWQAFNTLKEHELLEEGGSVSFEVARIAKQLFVADGDNWILREN